MGVSLSDSAVACHFRNQLQLFVVICGNSIQNFLFFLSLRNPVTLYIKIFFCFRRCSVTLCPWQLVEQNH